MSEHTDNTALTDGVEVEVKGPGKEWAWRDKMFEKQAAAVNEDADYEIKGPGPEWETNEEGVFINRDD